MKNLNGYSRCRTWSSALLLGVLVAGCGGGGGGRDPVLGADVANLKLVVPPGTVAPGACPVDGPKVTFTDPTDGNLAVSTSTSGITNGGKLVTATFSEAMNAATINATTFKLAPTGGNALAAQVTYGTATNIATLTTASALLANTAYTAVIQAPIANGTGTPLSCNYAWNFKTAPTPVTSLQAVNLTCAAGFAILAGSTVTNTGPTIINNGDLGLSPGSAVTGFPPGTINGGVIRINDVEANNGKLCLTTAYNDAAGRTTAPITVAGNIGGQTLAPGLYKSTSTLAISSGDLTLAGPAEGVWIFQVASTLDTTPGRKVILSGGALAKNVFWQVGTSATLDTTSDFQGNILADQSITLKTGAVLNGRALTRIGAVSLDTNTVTKPAP